MATITARLDDWLRDEIERFWREHGHGPSSGFRRVAEEWWAVQQFPQIEFREGAAGRRAGLRGGPDVWEIEMVRREYDGDRAGLHVHFEFVPPEHLDQALAYADRFSADINDLISRNERLGRLLEASSG